MDTTTLAPKVESGDQDKLNNALLSDHQHRNAADNINKSDRMVDELIFDVNCEYNWFLEND